MTYILGLDIGSSNIKGIILDVATRNILTTSCPTGSYNASEPGWAEYNPATIFQSVIQVISELVSRVEDPKEIRSLAISSMGETGVPVDRKGNCIYPAIAWYDLRTTSQARWVREKIGAEKLFSITGLPISTSYGLLKLLWIKENHPEIFNQCCRWLPIGDYIAYRLCRVQATDRTSAWRTMGLDINTLRWSQEILNIMNISPDILADLVPSGTPLGNITKEVAEMTGLSQECLVVSGGMDAVCGMVAVGATVPGVTLDIIGTSEILISTLDRCVLNEDAMNASIDVGPHAVDGKYLTFGSMTASGSIVEWFVRTLSNVDSSSDISSFIEDLTKEAALCHDQNESPILFLPHLRGSRTPYSDTKSKGVFLGVTQETTRGQLFLGVLEGLCFESKVILDTLQSMMGIEQKKLWISGGVTKNQVWMMLKANIMGHGVQIPTFQEISAYGAAVIAAHGANLYQTLQEAAENLQLPGHWVMSDDEHVGKYKQKFITQYKNIYSSMKTIMEMRQ